MSRKPLGFEDAKALAPESLVQLQGSTEAPSPNGFASCFLSIFGFKHFRIGRHRVDLENDLNQRCVPNLD